MKTKTKESEKDAKKFDYKTIKTFEDACNKENIDPAHLPDVSMLLEEFRKPIIAAYKLMIIFKAINNGWVPNWNDSNQYKYYPWFGVLSSGSGFSLSTYSYAFTASGVGSRLCTDTSTKALYIAEQFKQEYQDYFLYSE